MDKCPRLLTFRRTIPRCIVHSSPEAHRGLSLVAHSGDQVDFTFSVGFSSFSISLLTPTLWLLEITPKLTTILRLSFQGELRQLTAPFLEKVLMRSDKPKREVLD